jgi:hypothetical protein
MTTGVEQGRRLEERIGAFFEANGYRVSRNVVLEGRSGGRHEIDVLAEKSDALTTYKVAVECKAWQTPIEKDVVAKLYHVVDDLGLSKGIVVSLAGSRSGAQVAARERGIELWGTDELRHHLGEVPTAQLASARAAAGRTTAWGRPVRISLEAARTALESSGKGALNLRTVERLVWMSPVWLPAFSVRISVTQPEARLLKNRLRSVSVVRVYDALSGTYLGPAPATGWEQVEVEARTALPPALHAAKVLATLRKTVDDYTRVSTQAAVERVPVDFDRRHRAGLPAVLRRCAPARRGRARRRRQGVGRHGGAGGIRRAHREGRAPARPLRRLSRTGPRPAAVRRGVPAKPAAAGRISRAPVLRR